MADRTARRTIKGPRARRGRPRTYREARTKVSLEMCERQVLEPDRLTTTIRSKAGAHLTQAEVIRALLDAPDESQLDVTTVVSGAELKRMLARKVSARRGRALTALPGIQGLPPTHPELVQDLAALFIQTADR